MSLLEGKVAIITGVCAMADGWAAYQACAETRTVKLDDSRFCNTPASSLKYAPVID